MRFIWNGFSSLTIWLTIAGLGAPFHPGLAAQAVNLDSNSLKFELLEQHQIVVRGAIGPLDGLKLLIDTGSTPSMVDRKVAKKLALPVQTREFVSFGQRLRTLTAVLPGIRLGPLNAEAVEAGVGDLSFLHGVDGIIGLDVLSRSSFSIDYKKQLLVFGPVEAGRQSAPLEATPPFLTIQIAIAGRPVRLLVDTGSGRLVLFARRMRDRLPVLQVHGELLMYHLSGTSRLDRVILPLLDAGGATINRIEGFMSDAPVDDYPSGIDGVLGLRVLASTHADFDFERRRLAFD
jgi:predicted aspartyl protease